MHEGVANVLINVRKRDSKRTPRLSVKLRALQEVMFGNPVFLVSDHDSDNWKLVRPTANISQYIFRANMLRGLTIIMVDYIGPLESQTSDVRPPRSSS